MRANATSRNIRQNGNVFTASAGKPHKTKLGSDKSHKRETPNREYDKQHYASHRIGRTKRNSYETYARTRRKTDRHREAIDD